MEEISTTVDELILKPKKEKLIADLEAVILGKEERYIPEMANPAYFEIWFYWAFDFKYIIIGKENFVIDLTADKEQELLEQFFENFKTNFDNEEKAAEEFTKLQQDLAFKFFSDCWEELEKKTNRKIRCFLIKSDTIRGIDVNKKVKIDGENIGTILNEEGILNHY